MISLDDFYSNRIITFDDVRNVNSNELATDTSGDITYTLNEHGVRSVSICDRSEYQILTLGCSWTMGIGVEFDKTWPQLISKKFKSAGVWNYGMYGISCSFIIRQCFKILNSGYIPDAIFVLWPGFSRREYFTSLGKYRKIGGHRLANDDDVVWKNNTPDIAFLELQNDYQDISEFWISYNFLVTLCNSYKIKLSHSIVGYYYEIFMANYEVLNKFINTDTFFVPTTSYQNDYGGSDGSHPGVEWHDKFATEFYNFINENNDE